jgi:IS30 family transposase
MGRPEALRSLQRAFWREVAEGVSSEEAARRVGLDPATGGVWFNKAGGMSPLRLVEPVKGRYLSMAEREEVAIGVAREESTRSIARRLGRAPSTVSREIRRNWAVNHPRGYRATLAQSHADARACRPKPSKMAGCDRLRVEVQTGLGKHWSPEQIARRLREDFPDDVEMRVSHETIYRSLYVQGRGGLRRELASCLRTGRALRRPRRRSETRRPRIKDMVMISERPAEAADRAVPGHWEGDLIIGKDSRSAIGTLVERSTRFVLLLHLPARHGAEEVRDAMTETITTLPEMLRRSLAWDQGSEMFEHAAITVATGLPIFFCDPASPWQRGTNENTNGLLRQYFPKSTDLSVHSREHLDFVAAELNGRPRKTLAWRTPAEALQALLSAPQPTGVATTA